MRNGLLCQREKVGTDAEIAVESSLTSGIWQAISVSVPLFRTALHHRKKGVS
jgi:hypothetical protein